MSKIPTNPNGSINGPYPSVAFAVKKVEDLKRGFSKYGSRYLYGRMGNPDLEPFEKWFAEFEGVEAGSLWATNTGMTAIDLAFLGSTDPRLGFGKKIVASRCVYGGTFHLLEMLANRGDIDLVWVEDPFDIDSWDRAVGGKPHPALVVAETPSNPNADIYDIEALAVIAHKHKSRLLVDNTLGVGLQNPIALGADAVVYSSTKYIIRDSSQMGGILVVAPAFRKEAEEVFDDLFVHKGMIMHKSAAEAAYLKRTTLRRDMAQFSRNAKAVAEILEGHKKVVAVHYPCLFKSPYFALAQRQMPCGGGGMFSFDLGSFEKATVFVEAQEEAYPAVHLGDMNNHLVTLPAISAHSKLSQEDLAKVGITPGLVRVSVSLEEPEGISRLVSDFLRILGSL